MKADSLIAAVRRKTTVLSFVGAVLYAIAFAAEADDDAVKIDNDQARVLVVSSAAGAKSEPHEHKMNRVMIYLDAGQMTLTEPAGKVQMLNFKAGEALWSPATGPHVSLNVSDHPIRIVEVELKSKPGGPGVTKPALLDWVKVDPDRYQVEIENDQVRVVRARYAAHAKGVLHEHPFNYVVIFLTESKMKVMPAEGESKIATKAAGEVTWGHSAKHIEENLNDKPLEVLVVEFKK